MESDICGENVSPTSVDRTEEPVLDGSSSLLVEGKAEGSDCADNVASQTETETVTQSESDDVKPKHDQDNHSLNDDQSGDYYEVISADGSIGEDDVDINSLDIDQNSDNFNSSNSGIAASIGRPLSETGSFNHGPPFVSKFEFPPGQKEDSLNFGAFHNISNNIPRPDKNFTIPPPNFKPLDIKPSLDFIGPAFHPVIQDPSSSKNENISTESLSKSNTFSSASSVDKVLGSVPRSSKEKNIVDWLDENGDPVPGAFDYVKPEEEPDLNKSSKVEYVFSVREKKDVPVKSEPSDVVNSGFLINQNVLHKNVAGNLGVLLENQLVQDPTRIFQDDEEKKLYEASRSGARYKAAVEAVTASSSTTDTPATVIQVVQPAIDNTKKERFPRFRRNRFADIKKDEYKPEETSEEKATKSTEEVALERQAVSEILNEVQRGAARAKEHGALGWQKCPVPVTNKTFLRNTLVSTLREPYRPPSKRGRYHVGLKQEDAGRDHGKREHDNDGHSSRSSRSRSRSSSGSCSSYSCSGSSFTDNERSGSRDRQRHFPRGGGRGSWHRGHYQYYDDAWAAYNAHYGYGPWYGQEALPMFCGPEGWPMDPYAAMYYGDPQAWMEYDAYYGPPPPPNFNARGVGRGFRGRGRGDFGRGRGGYEGDFRDYNQGFRSPGEFSPPRSRSRLSRSWSRNRSRSQSRRKSMDSRGRSRSRSLARSHTHSRSQRRSRDRSLTSKSDDKMRSATEINEKKKKKKKKKRKHKKSKKSKHKQKDEENSSGKKDGEEPAEDGADKDKISNESDSKQEGINNLEKEGVTLKHKKRKESNRHKNKGKSKRDGGEIIEQGDPSKALGNVAELRNTVVGKGGEDVEGCSVRNIDRQTVNEARKTIDNSSKISERRISSENRGVKHKGSYIQNQKSGEKGDYDGFRGSKSKERTKQNTGLVERDRRSESQDSRKRRLNDYRDEGVRGQQGINERDRRSESQDSRKRMRISEHRRVETVAAREEGRRGENQDSRAGVSGHRVKDRLGIADIIDKRGADEDSRAGISGHRMKDRLGTADVIDRKAGMSGHRVKDRLGTADVIDRRGTNEDSRAGVSGHRMKDRLGTADLIDKRGADEDSRAGISGHRMKDRLGTANVIDSGARISSHRMKDRLGTADVVDRKTGISGHRVKDRLGTADVIDRRGTKEGSRAGIRVTDHGDENLTAGMVGISGRRSGSQNRKKGIGDNINKNEKNNSITERARSDSQSCREDKSGKDGFKNKHGVNTTVTDRSESRSSKEGVGKEGGRLGRGVRDKESSESEDSMDEAGDSYNTHGRNIRHGEGVGSHGENKIKGKFMNNSGISRKDSMKITIGRSERSQPTESGRISEDSRIRQRSLSSHMKDHEKGESIKGGKNIYDGTAGNMFGTGKKSLQTDKKRESLDKKTVDKRSRSVSTDDSDENVDQKPAEKMKERNKEIKSGNEKEFSQTNIIKGSMRSNKSITQDREMKETGLEKQIDREFESGSIGADKRAFQDSLKHSKEKSSTDSRGLESQKYKESSKLDKFEHQKVVRLIRLNNEKDTVANKKVVKAKSLEVTKQSHSSPHTERHSASINETLNEAKSEGKLKGVKRSRKLAHNQEAEKTKSRVSEETIIPERSGESRKEKLRLKTDKKLKQGSQEGESSNNPTME